MAPVEAARPGRILVVSACTGAKTVNVANPLRLGELPDPPPARRAELAAHARTAEALYAGLQHIRLLRGVQAARKAGIDVDLRILSAGYGLVRADEPLLPYDATFATMKARERRTWARQLRIPEAIREALAEPFDLAVLLLGGPYLDACALGPDVVVGGPMLALVGNAGARTLGAVPGVRTVKLANRDARRFRCGQVGLKGELGARVLEGLASGRLAVDDAVKPGLLDHLDPDTVGVDVVIHLPTDWARRSAERPIRYFIPEWDDRVDRDFDFQTDTHSGGTGRWDNEVYAHQLLPEPAYDGILISKVVAERSRAKAERINALEVHRFLRVPPSMPIMGDCGAFGYIDQDDPPYETGEILDYYTRLGFDYGVSIDHLIVQATMEQRAHRYALTLHNAEAFLTEHRARGLAWTPIAGVQGWDPASYAEAARQCAAMGYRLLGLGGLVRTRTTAILDIVRAVHDAIPPEVTLHLFGVARADALATFAGLGVSSFDSASYLRRAWLGARDNYHTLHTDYCALRIPEAGKSFRAKRAVRDGRATEVEVVALERRCLDLVRAWDRDEAQLDDVLAGLEAYDALIGEGARRHAKHDLERTLRDRPWKDCPCAICREVGVEVIIFRGNNRNRRRGFHNTWVFYEKLRRAFGTASDRLAQP